LRTRVRRLVSHGMDRDLAKYKMELKADADRDIEKLRNELRFEIERHKNTLRMLEHEHRVRFSKLHERRAKTIARIYSLMVQAEGLAKGFVLIDTMSRDRATAAHEKVMELYQFFELNRLYLPNSICVILTAFINKLSFSVSLIKSYWTNVEFPPEHMLQERNDKMLEVASAFENEIPGIKSLLETEFRKLLGAVDEEWLISVDDSPRSAGTQS